MLHSSLCRFLQVCLFVAVVVIGPFSSHAGLLAYEGFDYTPGTSIAGQAGGSGWTNAWAAGDIALSLATNKATALLYTDMSGHTILTSGGSLVVGSPNGPAPDLAFPYRALTKNLSGGTGTTAGAGGTVWISFLYQRLNLEAGGAPYFRQANLGFGQGFTERLNLGGPNTSATVSNVISVWGGLGSAHNEFAPFQSAAHPLLPASTTFILVKVVTDGTAAADSAYVWFNPTNLTVEPNTATADLTDAEANLSGVNTLWLLAAQQNANGTNAVFQLDELRLGTTFADVTPNVDYGESPTILSDPEDLMVFAGQPASFTAAAVGAAPLAYQWFFNTNTALPNATNDTYTIASTVLGDAGGYSVVVSNGSGAATSAVAILTVETPMLPEITAQPQSLTRPVGSPALFSVTATGTVPLHYQWYYNTNTLLPGKTSADLSFTITSTNDSGAYSVIVTNNYGSVTSTVAQLTAVPPPPAFPGADGAARYVSGGRGGVVYHVTKLNSQLDDPERSSPGTFLYGLSNGNFPPGPRTIVFDVAGVFHLGLMDTTNWTSGGNAWDPASRQGVGANNLTIAGQTAPGPVIFMGGTIKPQGNNQIFRNITVAAGYGMKTFWEPDGPPPSAAATNLPTSYTMDAFDLSGQNIMIDHVDAWYGTDESISGNELVDNITIQYCNNALAQNFNDHSYGHLMDPGSNHKMSFIHCLDAHIRGRLPRVGTTPDKLDIPGVGALNDFRNNLFYNWFSGAGYSGGGQPSQNNFLHNFYLAGPGGDHLWDGSTEGGGTGIFSGSSGYTDAHVSGNLKDTNKDGDPNDAVSADGSYTSITPKAQAYDIGLGVTLSAQGAFTNVLRHVGSRWWDRDYDIALGNTGAIDTIAERLIHDVIAGSGRVQAWADDPYNISGTYNANPANEGAEWRSLWALRMDTNGVAPFNRPAGWDTDQDGMPDYWEEEHSQDPNVANNNNDFDNDLYTDLEEYLNEIAAWPAPGTIYFTGEQNNRYAPIFNWRVYGIAVNISGMGTVTTSSQWQPSRYDTAVITNQTVVVDAVGQHAGTLKLMSSAALNITNGWLKVATGLDNGVGCTTTVAGPGSLITSNLVNAGTLRLTGAAGLNISGSFTNTGTLDIMTWSGTLPGGLVNTGAILDRSLIVISEFDLSGSDITATIQGYLGHGYQLQYRDSLTSGDWQDFGLPIAGTNAPIVFTHPDGAIAQGRLYRISVN